MTWDPPDLWATIMLSIPGGVVAGILVLAGEVALRRGYERVQQRKAFRAIGQFFGRWESTINDAMDIPAHPGNPPNLGPISRASVQFALHGDFLRRAPNLIARYPPLRYRGPYLTELRRSLPWGSDDDPVSNQTPSQQEEWGSAAEANMDLNQYQGGLCRSLG